VTRPYLRSALVLLVIAAAGCGMTLGGAPLLVFPADGATLGCAAPGSNYVFVWNPVPNAERYTLEVRDAVTDTVIAAVTVDADETTAAVPDTAIPCGGVQYRWRVCVAFVGTNPTPACSGFWRFTVL
jgi:hypothetical protein